MKSYGAISPEQIIERFETRAKLAELSGEGEHEGKVWREAADLLRDTEFVGWQRLQEEARK